MPKPTKKELKEQRKLEKEEKQHWEEELQKRQRFRQYGIWGALAAVLILSAAAIFFMLNKPGGEKAVISDVINSSIKVNKIR